MIKAEIDMNKCKAEIHGDMGTIVSEILSFIHCTHRTFLKIGRINADAFEAGLMMMLLDPEVRERVFEEEEK